jgi:hypothetical protein
VRLNRQRRDEILHLSGMFVNYTALFLEGFFFAFRMASAARLSLSYWDMLLG